MKQHLTNGDWVEIRDLAVVVRHGKLIHTWNKDDLVDPVTQILGKRYGILKEWLGSPYDVAGRATERIRVFVPKVGDVITHRDKVKRVSPLIALALQA